MQQLFYLLCLLLLYSHPSLALPQQQQQLPVTVYRVMVSHNQPQFTIKLRSTPSSGFSWWLSNYNGQVIQPLSHHTITTNPKLLGAAAEEVWTFLVKNSAFVVPQQTQLNFIYARPWSLDQQASQTIVIVAIKAQA